MFFYDIIFHSFDNLTEWKGHFQRPYLSVTVLVTVLISSLCWRNPFRSHQLSHCVERASVYTTLWTERTIFQGLICDSCHHLMEMKEPQFTQPCGRRGPFSKASSVTAATISWRWKGPSIFKAPFLAVLSRPHWVERPVSQGPTEMSEEPSHSLHHPVPHLVNTVEETTNNYK